MEGESVPRVDNYEQNDNNALYNDIDPSLVYDEVMSFTDRRYRYSNPVALATTGTGSQLCVMLFSQCCNAKPMQLGLIQLV